MVKSIGSNHPKIDMNNGHGGLCKHVVYLRMVIVMRKTMINPWTLAPLAGKVHLCRQSGLQKNWVDQIWFKRWCFVMFWTGLKPPSNWSMLITTYMLWFTPDILRKVVHLFGVLASRTFLFTSFFVLIMRLCSRDWDAAVIGGDDLATCQRVFQVPAPTDGSFQFHSTLPCPIGSITHSIGPITRAIAQPLPIPPLIFPHVVKLPRKTMDRRFYPRDDVAMKEI